MKLSANMFDGSSISDMHRIIVDGQTEEGNEAPAVSHHIIPKSNSRKTVPFRNNASNRQESSRRTKEERIMINGGKNIGRNSEFGDTEVRISCEPIIPPKPSQFKEQFLNEDSVVIPRECSVLDNTEVVDDRPTLETANQQANDNKVTIPSTCQEVCATDDSFIFCLATVLTRLISLTSPKRGCITTFHAVAIPEINISDYLFRIFRYFGCSNECYVLSLVYIDRIVKHNEKFNINILNVHRLVITAVMLAAKFFDDIYYSNSFYAKVGGVKTKEINYLEAHFLSLINYQLFVSPQEYDQYRKNVIDAYFALTGRIPRQLGNNTVFLAPLISTMHPVYGDLLHNINSISRHLNGKNVISKSRIFFLDGNLVVLTEKGIIAYGFSNRQLQGSFVINKDGLEFITKDLFDPLRGNGANRHQFESNNSHPNIDGCQLPTCNNKCIPGSNKGLKVVGKNEFMNVKADSEVDATRQRMIIQVNNSSLCGNSSLQCNDNILYRSDITGVATKYVCTQKGNNCKCSKICVGSETRGHEDHCTCVITDPHLHSGLKSSNGCTSKEQFWYQGFITRTNNNGCIISRSYSSDNCAVVKNNPSDSSRCAAYTLPKVEAMHHGGYDTLSNFSQNYQHHSSISYLTNHGYQVKCHAKQEEMPLVVEHGLQNDYCNNGLGKTVCCVSAQRDAVTSCTGSDSSRCFCSNYAQVSMFPDTTTSQVNLCGESNIYKSCPAVLQQHLPLHFSNKNIDFGKSFSGPLNDGITTAVKYYASAELTDVELGAGKMGNEASIVSFDEHTKCFLSDSGESMELSGANKSNIGGLEKHAWHSEVERNRNVFNDIWEGGTVEMKRDRGSLRNVCGIMNLPRTSDVFNPFESGSANAWIWTSVDEIQAQQTALY